MNYFKYRREINMKRKYQEERLECAQRLRSIRKNIGLSQEKFAEILEISLSAYKKIESSENQISVNGLRRLKSELKVSSDYILFGEYKDTDEAWEIIQNSEENDKMLVLLRLFNYFTIEKKTMYPIESPEAKVADVIMEAMEKMRERNVYKG